MHYIYVHDILITGANFADVTTIFQIMPKDLEKELKKDVENKVGICFFLVVCCSQKFKMALTILFETCNESLAFCVLGVPILFILRPVK